MDLIIRNAHVITDGLELQADIGVRRGVVAALGDLSGVQGGEEVDAKGLIALPGLVDAGISSLSEGPAYPVSEQPFHHATADALAGGVTTMGYALDVQDDKPWQDGRDLQAESDADGACVDFVYHYAVSDWSPRRRDHLAAACEAGLPSIYICRSPLKGEALVHAALSVMRPDMTAFTNVSDVIVERFRRQQLRADGRTGPDSYSAIFPPWTEAGGLQRLASMVEAGQGRLCVMGISCRESLLHYSRLRNEAHDLVLAAKLPHLALSEEAMLEESLPRPRCTWPPLRQRVDQQALWAALEDGLVTIVCSGHHPLSLEAVKDSERDATEAGAGAHSLGHLLPLLYSEGPAKLRLDLAALSAAACADPAKLLGLYPRKGSLQPGSDADIVLLDPQGEGTRPDRGGRSGLYDFFAGLDVHGALQGVYLHGRKVLGENAVSGAHGTHLA